MKLIQIRVRRCVPKTISNRFRLMIVEEKLPISGKIHVLPNFEVLEKVFYKNFSSYELPELERDQRGAFTV